MSEFRVEVVRIGPVEKHPNADSLSITRVFDYPVILRTGDFKEGDRAVYVPIDAVVPADDARFAFLDGHVRIRAKRLRGIFSMGLLVAADAAWEVGSDIASAMRIVKYEPPEPLMMGGDTEKCPFPFPTYTDVEGFRRWPDVLRDGEEVVVTEKIHGANSRYAWVDGRLWCGSRTSVKKADPASLWWKAAEKNGLPEKVRALEGLAVYGEVFGQVQDLKYGAGKSEFFFRAFDMLDLKTGAYLDWDATAVRARAVGLPLVPLLHRGPWSRDLLTLATGKSELAAHMREGCVIHPVRERFDERVGRVILKMIGEEYLLRKGGTEFH
jgi:RNA ligase (TIGR02306 family)